MTQPGGSDLAALHALAAADESHRELFEQARQARHTRRERMREAIEAGCSIEDIADAVELDVKAAQIEWQLRKKEIDAAEQLRELPKVIAGQ